MNSYKIKEGDTLTKVSKAFGTTVEVLMLLNPSVENPDLIISGDWLNVPGWKGEEGSEVPYSPSRRDYFAIRALQALLPVSKSITVKDPSITLESISVELADLLIAELDKGNK